jgi:hypothetical protein
MGCLTLLQFYYYFIISGDILLISVTVYFVNKVEALPLHVINHVTELLTD